jgi:LemA protein
MSSSVIILIVVGAAVLFGIVIYNRLVALRQARNNAFSDIDVQLRQRYQLVPQLVETVKGYAGHEKEVFEKVTEARAQVGQARGSGAGRLKAEGMLGGALAGLFAVAESYPALKADQNFRQLMTELADIENKIAAARRFFNNATGEYNTSVQQFPASLLAGLFGFRTEPFFELETGQEEAIRKGPDVSFT